MSNILDYGKETVLEFIQTKIKNSNNFKEDILDKIKYVSDEVIDGSIIEDRSSQGFYYERLWDLCIKFGVTNLTLPSINGHLQTSYIINENPNNKSDIQFQKNCWIGNKLNINPGGYLLQSVRSGNSGGYSDITFLNKFIDEREELYFISVKYFKEEKEISKYDIGKLCSLIREHEQDNRIIKLYIFVKDREKAIQKFKAQHSSSNILIKYINPDGNYEHIYDVNDLQEAFFKLKKILEQYNYLQDPENINDFQENYLKVLKQIFIPRFHQELFILKINKLIEDGEKNILVGAIPRSGKSYIMAGAIIEYVKSQEQLHPGKKVKFLMMTPAPNETFKEYQSIFNTYIEFDKLGIDVVTYEGNDISKKICKNKDKHCVIIISKQKLGWSAGSKAEKILEKDDHDKEEEDMEEEEKEEEEEEEKEEEEEEEEEEFVDKHHKDITKIRQRINKLFQKNPDINMMFLDEAHFGMSTEKAQLIVDVLDSVISNTIKIYVTATYNKPLQAYNVKAKCKLTWDMNDIQIMQKIDETTINDNHIKKQFGKDIYEEALEYFGDKTGISLINKFKKDYAIFPKPYLITSLWDKEFLNVEKLKIGDTEFGWDMNKLFATEGDSGNFANEEQIKEMMRYYFGYPDKDENYDKQTFYRKRGILPRIRNICLNKCRTLQPQHKTTQLWFLPLGNGKIKNKTKALVNLLTKSNEFNDVKRNYHFFIAVDIEDKTKKGRPMNGVTYMGNPHNIKSDIEEVEKKIKEGKIEQNNLIILAGQRLQLGISLRNVDIVTLWNSISSADAIFQMLFRSMTEVDVPSCEEKPNEYCAEKKFGFMVDMNPQRAFTNVLLFNKNISKTKDATNKQQYRQITDLINIDEDVLFDKYGDDEKSKNDFVNDLFNKLTESWNKHVKTYTSLIKRIDWDMSKLEALKKAFERINIEKGKKTKDEIDGKDDDEMIDPGKKKEKLTPNKKREKKDVKEKEINLIETASEVISEFISLLNIFTLYADKGAQCILTDSSKSNAQITLIDDIDVLKSSVYQDEETKDVFLKILNGRLSGKADEPYPENIIEKVLDAMDKLDNTPIVNKIIMSQKKEYYTINEPNELIQYIDTQLKPKEKEKKENGEVFTPLSLVNEMLDKLDEAYIKEHKKSIFTEDEFKWLDPAVGIGNFPIIVYQRLMKGLVTKIPNEEERRKHILEQMIYSAELTPKNVFIYKKIFCGDKYKLNIYQGDTLKMDVKKEFKLHADFVGFDVVMGNPPYQKKIGDKNTQPLWHLFVIHSLKICKSNGYLVFVHPSGWRSPEGAFKNVLDLIMSKNLKYLCMNDFKKGQEVFKVGTNFDYYVLQNKFDPNNITTITDINGKTTDENINSWKFIPSGGFDLYDKIIAKDGEDKVNVLYSSSLYERRQDYMSNTETYVYKYPCVYTITRKDGVKFYYSSIKYPKKEKDDMFVPKVIWSNGLGTYPIVDLEGKYALTSFSYAIIDDIRNLKNIENALNNPKFIELMEYVKFQNNKYNYKVISIFKKDFWKAFLNNKDETKTEDEVVEPKKSPIKLDKKIVLVPATEVTKDIPIAIPSPIPKKKRTKKKRPNLIFYESSDDKVVPENPIDTNTEKIFNPLTKRHVKNTSVNRKKIVLIPATEAIPSPIPKKKRTKKKRPNLIFFESSDDKVVPENPIDTNTEKIFNSLTKRHVKNTSVNRKKIEQQTLKRGGKPKKKSRKVEK